MNIFQHFFSSQTIQSMHYSEYFLFMTCHIISFLLSKQMTPEYTSQMLPQDLERSC